MPDKADSASSGTPNDNYSNSEKAKELDGFVDELKNVLSDLNKESQSAPPRAEPAGFSADIDMPSDVFPPASPSSPPDILSDRLSDKPSLPQVDGFGEPMPTDTDFWNGNVLGWPSDSPSEGDTPPISLSLKKNPPAPESEPDPFAFTTEDLPAAVVSETLPIPASAESVSSADREQLDPFLFGDTPAFASESVPPPPPPIPPRERLEKSAQTELEPEPLPAAKVDENLDEIEEVKPENLLQVACIFPEGAEKTGQQFVTRLREAAARFGKDVQAVFVHSWKANSLDPIAWEKSARLSGADTMFILLSKKDQTLFSTHRRKSLPEGIDQRLVFVEQILMKTLYADIMADIKRKS